MLYCEFAKRQHHYHDDIVIFAVRSPIYGHVSTTLLGLPTIRAFNAQELFTGLFFEAQDDHTRSWFTFVSCAGWLGFRLELLCLIFIGFVVFVCIAVTDIGINTVKTYLPTLRAFRLYKSSFIHFISFENYLFTIVPSVSKTVFQRPCIGAN